MQKDKIFFYGEVNTNNKNSFSLDTSKATFRELSELLGILKMVEIKITQHLLDLVPDWMVEENHNGDEDDSE